MVQLRPVNVPCLPVNEKTLKEPMTRFSIRLAIAEAFGFDYADIENDHRYQYGHTPCPIYTVGEGYYTATKAPNIRPKEDNDYRWLRVDPPSGHMPDKWQLWKLWSQSDPERI